MPSAVKAPDAPRGRPPSASVSHAVPATVSTTCPCTKSRRPGSVGVDQLAFRQPSEIDVAVPSGAMCTASGAAPLRRMTMNPSPEATASTRVQQEPSP